MLLAAMSNLSVEYNLGIGELWEKIQCVYYQFPGSSGDVNMLTSIMMHGRTHRVAMLTTFAVWLVFHAL
jgi:hypothetical protein